MLRDGVVVRHPDLGVGRAITILGGTAVVDFYGERVDVPVGELVCDAGEPHAVATTPANGPAQISFRRTLEALNLGVVPPTPAELIEFTIGGPAVAAETSGWLARFPTDGLCKVVLGDYGSGKSHYLRLAEATALQAGWVVSWLEFDPKAADPAKPHLVYRGLVNNLHFPPRSDGSQIADFEELIHEVRKHWDQVCDGEYFRSSPWFRPALEVLRHCRRDAEGDYGTAVSWLAGADVPVRVIQNMGRQAAIRRTIPRMPRQLETADIYVHHLVVLAEVCGRLGYSGLLLLLDEAEHVRRFTAQRQHRAGNFLDILARAAHAHPGQGMVARNDHGIDLGTYWDHGPHFGVVVGLTEGDLFADTPRPLHQACTLLHDRGDVKTLEPPSPDAYGAWCRRLMTRFCEYRPEHAGVLAGEDARAAVAAALRQCFAQATDQSRVLRRWIKLGCLVPSMVMAGNATSLDKVIEEINVVAAHLSGQRLPWDDTVG